MTALNDYLDAELEKFKKALVEFVQAKPDAEMDQLNEDERNDYCSR